MKGHLTEAIIDELVDSKSAADTLEPDVEQHLSSCAECREELTLARLVNEALDGVPEMEPPALLLENVMAGVAHKTALSRGRTVMWAALGGLAAIAIVVLWLASGGATGLVIEALQTVRALEMVSRIANSVWRTIPVELFLSCTLILLASSAALGGLVGRVRRAGSAAVEAG